MTCSHLHPLVVEYFTSDATATQLARKHRNSREPLVLGFVKTVAAFNDTHLTAETLEHLAGLPLDGAPPDMVVMLMTFWAHLSSDAGRLLESNAILHRAKALINARTNPLVSALAASMEADLARRGGHWRRVEELLKQILKLVPLTCPRRTTWVAWYYELLCLRGLGRSAEAQSLEQYLQRHLTVNFPVGFLAAVKTTDYLERCLPEEARVQLRAWSQPETASNAPERLASCKTWLNLLTNQWHPALTPPVPGETTAPEAPEWLISTYALQHRQPQLGMQWARAYARKDVQSFNGLSADAFTLIRAELACGHVEGSEHWLHLRRQHGVNHYLDDLFYARLHVLKGDFALAARYFRTAWLSASKYGAEARFNFELGLACELSPFNLARLANDSKDAGESPKPVNPSPRPTRPATNRLIGKSKALRSIQETVSHFATLDLPVLITGETGTGKEMVARALHVGNRAKHPFIAVNCGAIAESLLESELFGHVRGAFTGAERERAGVFIEAGRGTLFLDEIGEISPRLQVSLLRVLENNEIRPVGSSRPLRAACRMIFATNVDLEAAVRRGAFRSDLLYRLRRLEVHIPPLRERRDDIMPLVDYFLNLDRTGDARAAVTSDLERLLLNRQWPGNVRELRNEIERMRLLNSDKSVYGANDLSGGIASMASTAAALPIERELETDANQYLRGRRTRFRRLQKLRSLFQQHPQMSRIEVAHIMNVSVITAGHDLKALENERYITRVCPTRSPSTHYFQYEASSNR